jgi:Thiamine monophosphate synthase
MEPNRRVDFRLLLISDRNLLPPGLSLLNSVEQALNGGLPAIQLREKDLPARDLFRLAEQLRDMTRRYGARLLIN